MLSARRTTANPEPWDPAAFQLGLQRRGRFACQHRFAEVVHHLAVRPPMDREAVAPDLIAVIEEHRVGNQEAEDLGAGLDRNAMPGQDVLA
eukprot:10015931-Heterocapsa_arctica.AAC.1